MPSWPSLPGNIKALVQRVGTDTRQEIAASFDIYGVIYNWGISVEAATVNSSRRGLMTGLAHFISVLQFVLEFRRNARTML